MTATTFVSYIRVSTSNQGESGLGLEAQRQAVREYLARECCEFIAEVVESREWQSQRPTSTQSRYRIVQAAEGDAHNCSTRPTCAQCGLHLDSDGSGYRIHRRRFIPREQTHYSHARRFRRTRARQNPGTNQGGACC